MRGMKDEQIPKGCFAVPMDARKMASLESTELRTLIRLLEKVFPDKAPKTIYAIESA